MKKTILIVMAMLCMGITQSKAQNLMDLLKGVNSAVNTQKSDSTKSNSASNVLGSLGNVVAGLLGTNTVNSKSLVGTWTYQQPAIVFESENLLTNVGGMAAGQAAEKKLQTYLDKIGFTAGKVQITFKEDGTGVVAFKNKNIPFQWSVKDADLTINLASSALTQLTGNSKLSKYTSFKINCKLGFTDMQLSFKADKMAEFISKVVTAVGSVSNNTTLSSVASMVNKVDGMYLGLTFKK